MERHRMKRCCVSLAAIAVFAPGEASAHLVSSGMGTLYDGISHFGLSPEDFLPVIALALFAGLRGPRHARWTLLALTLAWLAGAGLALTGIAFPPALLPAATAVLFLAIGGLLASNISIKPEACMAAACCLGLARGAADLTGIVMNMTTFGNVVGMDVSLAVTFALASSITLPLERLWAIAAARVGGSWLAALGLLFAGWIIRYGAQVQ
jgi:urease accessory protein